VTRVIGVVLIIVAYLTGVNLFFRPVQIRMNHVNGVDVAMMSLLIVPFIASRWILPSRNRATRIAWYVTAFMAVDAVMFAVVVWAPTGGHPSLEALALVWTGVLKAVLAPAAVAALAIGFAKGERSITIALGLVCTIGESVYALVLDMPNHPLYWLLFDFEGPHRGPSKLR
jgi:hypothetical protein